MNNLDGVQAGAASIVRGSNGDRDSRGEPPPGLISASVLLNCSWTAKITTRFGHLIQITTRLGENYYTIGASDE